MKQTRVSFVLSHPIQYFSPLLRQLANTESIELTVYYCTNPDEVQRVDKGFGRVIAWDIPLLSGYRSLFLRNLSPFPSLDNKFWGLINLGIVKALMLDRSDVVIVHGWSYFTNCLAIIVASVLGKKVWLRGENPFNQELQKPKVLRMVKKIILQHGLFQMVNRFLYIGTQNRDFYSYYGVSKKQLVYAPYSVDSTFFNAQALQLSNKRTALRQMNNLPVDAVIILFSGKYIYKKRPVDLLKAYARLQNMPVALVMVGEGDLREQMEELIKQFDLKNVFLTGFINQSEISNYYALADIFVLPSGLGETWGLVVNEAMLFHLPLVVSSTAGCAVDLVKQGENGFIFKEGNIDELANYLSTLVKDTEFRKRAGNHSRKIIEAFDYSVMIKNIEEEINTNR